MGAAAGPLLLRRLVGAGDRRWLFGPFAVRGGVDLTLATVSNPVVAGSAGRLQLGKARRATSGGDGET